MEVYLLLRSLGGLGVVLALLAGVLWAVRRYDLRLPGRAGGGRRQRIAIVERLTLDARRSLVLVRRDGNEHLLLIAPEGSQELGEALPAPEEGAARPISLALAWDRDEQE